MHLLSRWRATAARHPLAYWSLVALLAVAAGGSLAVERARVTTARDAWGATRPVAVAAHDLAPGDPLAVRSVELPAALVPAAALGPPDVAADAVALQHVGAGEVITSFDVGGGRLPLLPLGWIALTVRLEPPPPVAAGDAVVALTADGVLVDAAVVVEVADDTVTVGVPAGDAPAVAEAARLQLLAIGLVRPGARPA